MLSEVLHWVAALPAWLAIGVLALLPMLEASTLVGIVFPGETSLLIAGVLVHDHRIGVVPTFVTCSIAVIIGDAIGYALGRRWGERIARRISAKRWERARRYLARKGAAAIVVGRFVAVMRALVPAAAGAAHMPFRRFALANSLGGVLWTATSILVGWAAGAAWELAHWFFLGAALVVAAAIAIVWRLRRRRGTRSARDRAGGVQMPITTNNPDDQRPRDDRLVAGDRRAQRTTAATISGGSSLEAFGGAGAVVLAILALSGILPLFLTAIATIAIGAALLAHGLAVAARWNDTVARAGAEIERVELAGGMSSEVLGGAAGIALGVLALANVMPMVLLPIAAIVLGGSILLATPAQPEVARFAREPNTKYDRITYEGVQATSGAMALAGAGAVVLGILALLHVGPVLVLSVIAMLAVGGAELLSGGALTARFAMARR